MRSRLVARRCGALLGALVVPAVLTAQRDVALAFRAVVADAPFACTTPIAALGTTRARTTVTDFKFYVHDVRLELADGRLVPLDLADEAPWQSQGVALLDFEDGTGPCANGTPELRSTVRGRAALAPDAVVRGVRFVLGVPFRLNHADLAAQPAPLSSTRMFWSWNSGYKFLRIDLRSADAAGDGTPTPWMIHLGSTGCTPAGRATEAPLRCARPNRAEVAVRDLDPTRDAIAIDLAALLGAADLLSNTTGTAAGCMSAPNDPECGPVFAALGLPHPAAPRGVAPAFRVLRGAATASR